MSDRICQIKCQNSCHGGELPKKVLPFLFKLLTCFNSPNLVIFGNADVLWFCVYTIAKHINKNKQIKSPTFANPEIHLKIPNGA